MAGTGATDAPTPDPERARTGRSPEWKRRRGISAREREGNEPWARLQENLTWRYELGIPPGRRWEHPDPDDLANFPLFLRQAHRVVDRELRTVLATDGALTDPLAFDILRRVAERTSAVTDLAQYSRCHPATVSTVVSRLEAAGLVEREVWHRDLRVVLVRPTPLGRTTIDRLARPVDDLCLQLLDDLGLDEQRTLLRLVVVLADSP